MGISQEIHMPEQGPVAKNSRERSVAIIGAGVAGLAAGGLLARNGWKVRVFEAAQHEGGACAVERLDGYVFNNGAQYLMLPEMLDHVFTRLGAERKRVLPLQRVTTPQTIVLPDGVAVTFEERLRVASDSNLFDAALAQQELGRLVEKWQPVKQAFFDEQVMSGPFSYRRLLGKVWRHLPKFARSLEDELQASFSDPAFRTALSGLMLYAGVPPGKLPAPAIIALVSELADGLTLPEGGMGSIPEALARILSDNGGELHLDAEVERILLRDGRACGLQVRDYGRVEADCVLSAVSALTTYGRLLTVEQLPASLRAKVRRTPLSMSAFSVQLGLTNKIDAPGHLNYALLPPGAWRLSFPLPLPETSWVYYSVPTAVQPGLAPAGGSLVELAMAIPADESTSAWDEERKQAVADAAVRWLASRHELQVAVSRVRSPREFESQLRLQEGAIYGVSPAAGAFGLFPHRSPIRGLFQAGQTTFPGFGIPTAALSGLYAAEALLEEAGRTPGQVTRF
jgi:phytoene desaturase